MRYDINSYVGMLCYVDECSFFPIPVYDGLLNWVSYYDSVSWSKEMCFLEVVCYDSESWSIEVVFLRVVHVMEGYEGRLVKKLYI